jgi:hypothetical protein
MFKKTLIAAAVVATTATFGAAASTVDATATNVGVEYARGFVLLSVPAVTVVPGRDYDSGDIITLTYTGTTLVESYVSSGNTIKVTPTLVASGALSSNVEFLGYDGNTVQLLVTNPVSFETAGTSVKVSGLVMNGSDAAAKGKVKVSAAGLVDTVLGAKDVDESKAIDLVTYATQFGTTIASKFDGVVDVNALRKKFTDGSTSDTLVLSNTNASVGASVASKGANYIVKGDFSFLDTDGDGKLEAKEGSVSSTGGTATIAKDMMSLTVSTKSAIATGTVGITVNGAAGSVLPDQAYSVTSQLLYAVGTSTFASSSLNDASAGSWTLNGAKAHIPFLPYGSNYAQSVTVSNTSTQNGGVDLVIYVGDDTVEVEGIATAMAEGVTDISAMVAAAVADAGLSDGSYAFDVVVNAPDDAISVTAVYYAKSDGDRVRTK